MQTGYNTSEYSCHSFRRGGASLAFRLGLSRNEIEKRGNWRSQAVDEYILLDDSQDRAIAAILVNGAKPTS